MLYVMEQVTIGPKYQIVIPKKLRQHSKYLKPGNKVSVKKVDEDTYLVKVQQGNWVEKMAGLMTEAWKEIDPIVELNKGRQEWEERLKEFEKDFKE